MQQLLLQAANAAASTLVAGPLDSSPPPPVSSTTRGSSKNCAVVAIFCRIETSVHSEFLGSFVDLVFQFSFISPCCSHSVFASQPQQPGFCSAATALQLALFLLLSFFCQVWLFCAHCLPMNFCQPRSQGGIHVAEKKKGKKKNTSYSNTGQNAKLVGLLFARYNNDAFSEEECCLC